MGGRREQARIASNLESSGNVVASGDSRIKEPSVGQCWPLLDFTVATGEM